MLLREIRERNYDGGYTLLTDWLRPQRQQGESLAVRRFETPPGKQAQVKALGGDSQSVVSYGKGAFHLPPTRSLTSNFFVASRNVSSR
jgi:hypothetical protein